MTLVPPTILVADDEASLRLVLADALEDRGYKVITAETGLVALQVAAERPIDLAILDIRMPGLDGLQALRRLRDNAPDMPVIIITAHSTMQTAIDAMKAGAYDYITKPFDLDQIGLTVDKALHARRLARENEQLQATLQDTYELGNIVGNSEPMQQVFKTIGRVADKDVTVLIQGESGTGKELVAKAIHFSSNRARQPFVAVNCTAIPETLLESELFGHLKGAFTGANHARVGKFQLAEGGTVFLDEIGDLSPELQVKLLRVLQEREVEPLGGTAPIAIDVRVLAATNRDLRQAITTGQFREDLFYRLNVVPIPLPPLRERLEDLTPLVEYFIARFSREFGLPRRTMAPESLALLRKYAWPGNVRELENLIKRVLVLEIESTITPEHLTIALPQPPPPQAAPENWAEGLVAHCDRLRMAGESQVYRTLMREFERPLIAHALRVHKGNKVKTADMLGINRNTLFKKMRELNLA